MITEKSDALSRNKRRRLATVAIFVFLSIVVCLVGLRYSSFRWDRFFATLSQLDWGWLAGGASIALLSYFGRAARWKVMMLPASSRLGGIFAATLIGFSAVVLLGRAGEVVRPLLIARREQSTIATQAAIWILERLFDLLAILVLFGVGLIEFNSFDLKSGSILAPVFRVGGAVVTVAAGAASAILYVLARHPTTCKEQILRALAFLPSRFFHKVERTLASFLRGACSISSPRVMLSSLVLTVVEWLLVLAAVWCFFQAHPAFRDFGLLDAAVYLGFVSVGNIVQLPGIGGGVQIVSVVVLTELFHTPVEIATGLSLLVWAGLALIVLPFGVPLAVAAHLKVSDIRRDMRGIGDEAIL